MTLTNFTMSQEMCFLNLNVHLSNCQCLKSLLIYDPDPLDLRELVSKMEENLLN